MPKRVVAAARSPCSVAEISAEIEDSDCKGCSTGKLGDSLAHCHWRVKREASVPIDVKEKANGAARCMLKDATARGALKTRSNKSRRGRRSRSCICDCGRFRTSRIACARVEQPFPRGQVRKSLAPEFAVIAAHPSQVDSLIVHPQETSPNC